MGTNYYLMTRNKQLAHKYFAVEHDWGITDEEYEIVDDPYLGYEIHLNKCSMGWRPLFQKHKEFKSWKELERFYLDHADGLEIYDEYGDQYTWGQYEDIIMNHASVEPRPLRWVYDVDPIDKIIGKEPYKKRVHCEECEPESAEIWTPFDHVEYFRSELEAHEKYRQPSFYSNIDHRYWNDPDYKIDWTEGDFS